MLPEMLLLNYIYFVLSVRWKWPEESGNWIPKLSRIEMTFVNRHVTGWMVCHLPCMLSSCMTKCVWCGDTAGQSNSSNARQTKWNWFIQLCRHGDWLCPPSCSSAAIQPETIPAHSLPAAVGIDWEEIDRQLIKRKSQLGLFPSTSPPVHSQSTRTQIRPSVRPPLEMAARQHQWDNWG